MSTGRQHDDGLDLDELRRHARAAEMERLDGTLIDDAADEIAALRERVAELEGAVERVVSVNHDHHAARRKAEAERDDLGDAIRQHRRALEPNGGDATAHDYRLWAHLDGEEPS